MPLPVTPWTADTPITAKSLNLALYTIDGTLNKPQGILLHAQRPMSFEVIGAAGANLLFTTSPTGHRNIISQSGDTEAAVTILDSAGYYGQSTDGVSWISGYVFTPAVTGTQGQLWNAVTGHSSSGTLLGATNATTSASTTTSQTQLLSAITGGQNTESVA